METGGMKGRKKELIRENCMTLLKAVSELPNIHSGIRGDEAVVQSLLPGQTDASWPLNWMKVLTVKRGPLSLLPTGKTA